VLAHAIGPDLHTPDYTYLKGDITRAYSDKVKEVKRSFVFLNLKDKNIPAALIVFDKVVSSRPDFRKFWLLHSIEAPVINGSEVTVIATGNGNDGKLINTTLLPEPNDREINPVGGPGKECWVFGTNYPSGPKYTRPNTYERAAWRIEVSPKKAAEENYFLNVMQVMDGNAQKVDVKKIDARKVVGVSISDRLVFFSRNAKVLDSTFAFSVRRKGDYKILLTDLTAGNWHVIRNGKEVRAVSVNETDGVLYFEGVQGDYTIRK
jgi:heparin/heparan-sulfate lyase